MPQILCKADRLRRNRRRPIVIMFLVVGLFTAALAVGSVMGQ